MPKVAALALVAVMGTWSGPALAEYPERPVTLVVPFGAGGSTDVAARILADTMSQGLGQPIVVENKPGAGGMIGARDVVNAPADGYRILFTSSGLIVDQAMSETPAVDVASDFTAVAIPLEADLGLMVNPALAIASTEELIRYAKEHPGELRSASSGIGTTIHFAFEWLKAEKDLDIKQIPYQGGADAMAAALSGEAPVVMLDVVYSKPQIDADQLRLLATGGSTPSPFFPDYPTIAEAADLPGYEANYWIGLFLPQETEQQVVDLIRENLEAALAEPETAEKLAALGFRVLAGSSATADERIATELARWQHVAAAADIEKK